MGKENDTEVRYTCAHLCKEFYCGIKDKKATGSIKGDIIGPRFCIQKLPAKHKRGVACDLKKLVVITSQKL